MKTARTPEYWPARIPLGIGVLVGVAAVAFAIVMASPPPYLGGNQTTADIGPLTIPQSAVASLVAGAMAIGGLVWQVRIFRGAGDKAPPMRYRNR